MTLSTSPSVCGTSRPLRRNSSPPRAGSSDWPAATTNSSLLERIGRLSGERFQRLSLCRSVSSVLVEFRYSGRSGTGSKLAANRKIFGLSMSLQSERSSAFSEIAISFSQTKEFSLAFAATPTTPVVSPEEARMPER
jgi:hypothetical protein